MKYAKNLILAAALALGISTASAATPVQADEARIAEKVRKEIVTLPFYSIFDHVTIGIEGDEVTLRGSVFRPSMKKSVERVAARVEGVSVVHNLVDVQPLSNFDNSIRRAVFFNVYGHPALNRYGLRSVGPIHIVVNNGHVTLEGVVLREADKHIAGIVANGVSGVFSVTNNLRFEIPKKS